MQAIVRSLAAQIRLRQRLRRTSARRLALPKRDSAKAGWVAWFLRLFHNLRAQDRAMTTGANLKSVRSYTPLLGRRSCPLIGSERRRFPVAAKIALVTAGWIMVAPGSPTPPHRLPGVGEM